MKRHQSATVVIAVFFFFTLQTGLGHKGGNHPPCTGPHQSDPGCGGGGTTEEPKIFQFWITTNELDGNGATGFLDNDRWSGDANPVYEDGVNRLSAEQDFDGTDTAWFALRTGGNSKKHKIRKVSVDLETDLTLSGVTFQQGLIDSLIEIGEDDLTVIEELDNLTVAGSPYETTFFMRGDNLGAGLHLIISYVSPAPGTVCDNISDMPVLVWRTSTLGVDSATYNEWEVGPQPGSPACAFLWDPSLDLPAAVQVVAMPLDFKLVIREL